MDVTLNNMLCFHFILSLGFLPSIGWAALLHSTLHETRICTTTQNSKAIINSNLQQQKIFLLSSDYVWSFIIVTKVCLTDGISKEGFTWKVKGVSFKEIKVYQKCWNKALVKYQNPMSDWTKENSTSNSNISTPYSNKMIENLKRAKSKMVFIIIK